MKLCRIAMVKVASVLMMGVKCDSKNILLLEMMGRIGWYVLQIHQFARSTAPHDSHRRKRMKSFKNVKGHLVKFNGGMLK